MAADRFDIVDVVLDASCQPCRVADAVGPAAVAQVEEDQRATAGQPLALVPKIDPVGDDDDLRAMPTLRKNSRTPSSVLT